MALGELERRVVEEVAARSDDLLALAGDLIAFDTTARTPGDPAREEAALQRYLAERLAVRGARVEVWEPSPDEVAGSRQIPPGLDFAGYPQLVATFPGRGGGRSLLLNGHIDVVSPEPLAGWTRPPREAWVGDGLLYGRGACDMKGGVAAMVHAAEVLAALEVPLAGDLLVNTVTDEESTSAGGVATVARGVRADAAIVTEPTSLRIGIACRGSLMPTIVVPGRAGHAGAIQAHWTEGGAVNAAEKAVLILDAVRRLRDEWRGRPDHRHAHLPGGDVVVTTVHAGDWEVTYPASCRISCHLTYLPAQADAQGYGTLVEEEFTRRVLAEARADPWLAEHPPVVTWGVDVPPSELPVDEPVVGLLQGVAGELGAPGGLIGTDYWNDGATLTQMGKIPAVTFGPGTVKVAHTVDEHVPVDELVRASQCLALAALRFCGPAVAE